MTDSVDELKELIIRSIEKEVQNYLAYSNCTEEDFTQFYAKCWSKFYSMIKQYDYDTKMPLGLFVDPVNEGLVILIRKASVSLFTKADISQFYHSPYIVTLRFDFFEQMLKNRRLRDIGVVLSSLKTIHEYNVLAQRAWLTSTSEIEANINELSQINSLSVQIYPSNFRSLFRGYANLLTVNTLVDNLIYKDNT